MNAIGHARKFLSWKRPGYVIISVSTVLVKYHVRIKQVNDGLWNLFGRFWFSYLLQKVIWSIGDVGPRVFLSRPLRSNKWLTHRVHMTPGGAPYRNATRHLICACTQLFGTCMILWRIHEYETFILSMYLPYKFKHTCVKYCKIADSPTCARSRWYGKHCNKTNVSRSVPITYSEKYSAFVFVYLRQCDAPVSHW